MDAVGVTLGAVTLVTTFEQFRSLYKICKRLRRFKEGIDDLLDELVIQQAVFKHETWTLLISALGRSTACKMMEDNTHFAWSDPDTQHRLDVFLGDSKEAMFTVAKKITKQMRSMQQELSQFKGPKESTEGKAYRQGFRNRFKFTFSEDRFRGLIKSMRQSATDFRTIRAQADEVTIARPEPDSSNTVNVTRNLEKAKATQLAAQQVHEVLRDVCKLHSKHHVQFCLKPVTPSSSGSQVQFQIAFGHLSRRHEFRKCDPLWFIVESVLTGTISTILESTPAPNSGSKGLVKKRSISEESSKCHRSGRSKRVRFGSPSPTELQPSKAMTASVTFDSLLGKEIKSDLCTYLRTVQEKLQQQGGCIGVLQCSSKWQHRVLHSRGPYRTGQCSAYDGRSLASLLSLREQSSIEPRPLNILQRLRLAKLLSTALLTFHGTPWLDTPWTSQDIILYNVTGQQPATATICELDAFVEVPVAQGIAEAGLVHDVADPLSPLVHSPALFRLGVMLLELAFERPLKSMRTALDSAPGMPPNTADVYTAYRLSKEVPLSLGLGYTKIVERCLWCDFGHGSNLSESALQIAVQQKVVTELDKLQSALQDFAIY